MCGIDVAFPEWRRRPQLTVQEWINSGRLGAALTRPQREFAELRLGTRSFLALQESFEVVDTEAPFRPDSSQGMDDDVIVPQRSTSESHATVEQLLGILGEDTRGGAALAAEGALRLKHELLCLPLPCGVGEAAQQLLLGKAFLEAWKEAQEASDVSIGDWERFGEGGLARQVWCRHQATRGSNTRAAAGRRRGGRPTSPLPIPQHFHLTSRR